MPEVNNKQEEFSFSYHPNTKDIGDGTKYKYGWRTYQGNIDDLARAAVKCAWSPIIWKDGVREGVRFIQAQWAGLDFDEGDWSIKQAQEFFQKKKFTFILGTTRSNMILKNDKICERFRVMIPLEFTVTGKELYCYNMRRLTTLLPIDVQCKDAGRFFWPCTEIIFINQEDNGTLAIKEIQEEPKQRNKKEFSTTHHKNKIIPGFIVNLLNNYQGQGNRHNSALTIGRTLAKRGFSDDEIIELVRKSSLIEAGEDDIVRTARNGAEYGRRLRSEWERGESDKR